MKKNFTVFFLSFILFFLIFGLSYAAEPEFCDESHGGTTGLVPCNVAKNSGGPFNCQCQLYHFFILLNNIFLFLVKWTATPLAVLMLTIGGIMILISGGNPQLYSKGRELIKWAIIGLVLVFGAWVIIQFILTAMGYENIGTWNIL
ncbi:MAG: pilin [bacterium]|nr:pilin [bacterium]